MIPLRGCLKTECDSHCREDSETPKVVFHDQAEISKRSERSGMATTGAAATTSQNNRPANKISASGGSERYSLCVALRVRVADAPSRPPPLANRVPLLSHVETGWDVGADTWGTTRPSASGRGSILQSQCSHHR